MVRNAELPLICRRDNGLWDIPGSAVEAGETVPDAARRKLQKATGLHAPDVTLLDVFSGPAHQHTCPDGHVVEWVTALHLARGFSGYPRAGDNAAAVRWWPFNGLPTAVVAATQSCFSALHVRLEDIHPGATP